MKMFSAGAWLAAAMILASTPALAADNPQIASEVMALARAQWSAEMSGKSIAEQSMNTADDYTEFNADFPARIEGKAFSDRITEAFSKDGSKSLVGDMANPHVQVYGDTAILTYNFVGVRHGKDGTVTPANAKSTRVYVKMNGKWMLVHANFAPVMVAGAP